MACLSLAFILILLFRVDRCTLVNLGIDFLTEFVIANPQHNFSSSSPIPGECEPEIYDNGGGTDDVQFVIAEDFSNCGANITVI